MFEFALPDLGEGVAEGEILEWHVSVGDAVSEDDVLLEVETDKAAVEVPSPVDGTIAERHGEAGDVVETGAVIVTIDREDERSESSERASGSDRRERHASGDSTGDSEATESTEEEPGDDEDGPSAESDDEPEPAAEPAGNGQRVFAPPSVRRLARELGVAIESVSGSGPSGRVTEDDVRAATEGGEDAGTEAGAVGDGDEDESATATGGQSTQVKSAVRRVDQSDATDGETTEAPAADEPAVKSAVRSTASTADRERTLATPATRRLARELGVDVDAVPTDLERDGEPFVDEGAVRAFAEREPGAADEAVGAAEGETTAAMDAESEGETTADTDVPTDTDASAGTDTSADLDVSVARTDPYQGIRRRIGERMAQSRREVPHATHHDRVEVAELVAARDRLKPLAEDRGVNLTYTPFILKCVGAALQDHPVLNTRIDVDAEEIHYLGDYNVGVATDTERGLLVPVVRDVDDRGIMELAEATNDVVARARDGSIGPDEMQGGTFTVTNVGAIGGEYADPVINVPQTAVLAVGSLRERPVAVDGTVEAKPTLPLSLAIDHRVIDGADAARFTNTLKTYLADPTRLLLE